MAQSRTRHPSVTPLPPLVVIRRTHRGNKATERQLDKPGDSLAIPQKNEKKRTKIYESLLKHLQQVSMKAWRFGQNVSGDKQTIGFQECTLTSSESPTKQKGMDSSAMHWQIPVLHGHFIFAINQHRRNGPRKATHHCILIFWECSTNLKSISKCQM